MDVWRNRKTHCAQNATPARVSGFESLHIYMTTTSDQEQRLRALELANVGEATDEEKVERAQKFYEFLAKGKPARTYAA